MTDKSRIKVKSFTLSRSELEDWLIARGEPSDIVITNIQHAFNQEGWLITAQSSQYEAVNSLALISTGENSILGVNNERKN